MCAGGRGSAGRWVAGLRHRRLELAAVERVVPKRRTLRRSEHKVRRAVRAREIEAFDIGLHQGIEVAERAVGLDWPGPRQPVVARDLGIDSVSDEQRP